MNVDQPTLLRRMDVPGTVVSEPRLDGQALGDQMGTTPVTAARLPRRWTTSSEGWLDPGGPHPRIDPSAYHEACLLVTPLGCPTSWPTKWHGARSWSWIRRCGGGRAQFNETELPMSDHLIGLGGGSIYALRAVEVTATMILLAVAQNSASVR